MSDDPTIMNRRKVMGGISAGLLAQPIKEYDTDIEIVSNISPSVDIDGWPHPRHDLSNTARASSDSLPDPSSLSEEWTYSTSKSGLNTPIIADDRLLASTYAPVGEVHDLNIDEGTAHQVLDQFDSPMRMEPVLLSGSVYSIPSGIHKSKPVKNITASESIEITTGSPSVFRSTGSELVLAHVSPDGTPEVVGLPPSGNEINWRYQPPMKDGEINDVALSGEILFVAGTIHTKDTATGPGSVSAVDLDSGELLWKLQDELRVDSIAVGETSVYSVTRKATKSINRESGAVEWVVERGGPGMSNVAVGTDQVFVGHPPEVTALSKSGGDLIWETDMKARSIRPSLGGLHVYASGNPRGKEPGKFAALNAETGERVFQQEFGNTNITAPAIASGGVFIGVNDGTVRKYS